MKTYELAEACRASGRRAFRLSELRLLLGLRSDNTAYKRGERLAAGGMFHRLAKGLYEVASAPASDFDIANLLRAPSYVSLESALSFHGILGGVPHRITSVTPRAPCRRVAAGREFEYARLQSGCYFGYERREGVLMATAEKALADILYFASKGLRRAPIEEYDLSGIDRSRFRAAARRMATPLFQKFLERVSL